MVDDVATTWGGKITLGRAPASNEILLGDANGNFALTPSSSISPSIQTLLDGISNTQGSILYRSATAWTALAPGTAGYVLSTNGAGADPSWVAQSSFTPTWTELIKTSDQSVTNSTTFVDVTGLTFNVDANTSYSFEFIAQVLVNAAPDIKFAINCTSVSSIRYGLIEIFGTTFVVNQSAIVITQSSDDRYNAHIVGFVTTGASSGTFALQFAQNTSSATAATVYKGSWGRYRTV